MKIVAFSASKTRAVRGTRVELGDELFALYDPKSRHYFIWCYTKKEVAEQMQRKLNGPENSIDQGANWRKTLKELVPSSRNL